MKKSLFWKLLLLCFFLVFSAALSQHIFLRFLSSSQALRHLYLQQWQQTAMQTDLQKQLVKSDLSQLPPEAVSGSLSKFVSAQGYQIDYQQLPYLTLYIDTLAVVDKNGKLITQLGEPEYQPGNLFTQMSLDGREDLVEALIGKDYFGTSTMPDYPGVIVAISLFDSQRNIVGAIVSHQRRQLAEGNNGIWFGLKAVTQGMFLAQADFVINLVFASLVFALVITAYLRRRITNITEVVKQWKKANFSSSIKDASSDELGQCADQLNDMSLSLQQAMLQTQQNASYKERLQLASELHDTVKQRLFAVNLKVAMFEKLGTSPRKDNHQLDTLVADISGQCQLAYEELEHVISALKPAMIIPFEDIEQQLLNKYSDTKLTLSVSIERHLINKPVPPLLLRVINEAVQNTLKHAKAKTSVIKISESSGDYLLIVSDDGKDKVNQDSDKGQGLALLQQSIVDCGGTLHTEHKQEGFVLTSRIPRKTGLE